MDNGVGRLMIIQKKTICPYDCPASCGLIAETDGTKILRVKGDPEHPASRGLICRKMQHYERSIHNEKRILTPLKRVGAKGEGTFAPITWEEAVKEITDRFKQILKEDGGDAILPAYYSGVMSVIQRKCGDAFFNRLGAISLVLTLCANAKSAGYESVMGETGCLDPRELPQSDFVIVWGSNVLATRIHTMADLVNARKQGKRVILIEACGRDMAPYCDELVQIRPGTDGALALAMMHVLEKEGLADETFLREKAEGYDEFLPVVRESTPQWAEEITGVPADTIVCLAREYAAASSPAILLGSGPTRYGNGGMTTRLITILSAFTGAWGRPGGGLCGCNHGAGPYVDTRRVTRPDFRAEEGRVVNINQLSAALKGNGEKKVKAFYVYGSNPLNSVSNQTAMLEGLQREDLFTVVHERFMTDTALYADIILPATFSVEQTDCYKAYGFRTFAVAEKIIDPPGQCKSNWDTFTLLGKAMGFEEEYFQKTEEEMLADLIDHPVKGLAELTESEREALKKGGVISTPFEDHLAFRTPGGKMRIVNRELADPVPHYTGCCGGEYPFRLIAVPDPHTLNSIFLERDELVNGRGERALMINPLDARKKGISDGDWILVWNDLAEVEFAAAVTDSVSAGTAAFSGVYSSAITGSRLQFNALNHDRLSDMGESTTLNDNTVDIKKLS